MNHPIFKLFEEQTGDDGRLVVAALAMLHDTGEDVTRAGLQETPLRFMRAWREKTMGYNMHPEDELKVFTDGVENVDEMVVVRDVAVESICEHHLERIWGVAHVAYIPSNHIVGLSKIYRLVNAFARRLQVQERLTQQVAHTLNDVLKPVGVGVVLECRHACMEARGICQRGQVTVTSALLGAFKDKPEARAEFLSLARTDKPL